LYVAIFIGLCNPPPGAAKVYRNRRFLQMCGHYLVEPVACTPGAGWEKGQAENQVGVARRRLFTPRLRFESHEELNAWLLDRCVAWAKAQPHPRAVRLPALQHSVSCRNSDDDGQAAARSERPGRPPGHEVGAAGAARGAAVGEA
jgi:hypothetical protein